MKNKMDLALGVAVGSSIQISLLALPLCVVVGWVTGHPFGLDLDPFSALALTASVIHCNFITSDATSHWLMGVQLIAVYIILAITYFVSVRSACVGFVRPRTLHAWSCTGGV